MNIVTEKGWTKKADRVMDKFNFEKVHKTMVCLDWKWVDKVPTVKELKECARELLDGVIKHYMEEGGRNTLGTGGFNAVLNPEIQSWNNDMGEISLTFHVEKQEE